jgi:hypothetical protein
MKHNILLPLQKGRQSWDMFLVRKEGASVLGNMHAFLHPKSFYNRKSFYGGGLEYQESITPWPTLCKILSDSAYPPQTRLSE